MLIKREVTVGQMLGFAITIGVVIFANWSTMNRSVAEMKVRQDFIEKKIDEDRATKGLILMEIKEVRKELVDIKVQLENKANRP